VQGKGGEAGDLLLVIGREEKICFIRWRDIEGYDTIPTTYSSFFFSSFFSL
jgi:hypothetical protein